MVNLDTDKNLSKMSLKEKYIDNFNIMVKEIFQQKNEPKDIKHMYDKMKLMV